MILAVGVLGERGGLPDDTSGALDVLQVNMVGAGSLLIHSARRLREQGAGTLVVLSSVAAERPRPRTSSTEHPRPAWTPSPRVSATSCTSRACACSSFAPASSQTRMTGACPRAAVHHAAGARPRRRRRTGPPRPHRVGAIRSTLADARP